MAQFNKTTQQFLGDSKTLYETFIVADPEGDVVGYKNAYGKPVITIDDDTVQHTSKNRRKVSGFEIIDYCTFQYDKQEDIWDEVVTGTASSTFDPYMGMVKLEVGAAAGDQIIRQTKRVMRYTPGRQGEASMSVLFNAPTPGIRRRFGLFDETDGAFFEDGGDGMYYTVVRRNASTGVEEERVARTDWNVDKLDGTGPSGIVADPNNVQLMVIEYEWYGSGQVEFKFVIDNTAYAVHQINHANRQNHTWASTPFLPIRVEFTNVTGESASGVFYHGSHSVLAEGEVSTIGREKSASNPIAGYTLTTAGTWYPTLSIRLKSNRLHGVVIPKEFTAATYDNTNIFFQIVRNATLTGGTWTSVGADSHVEYNTSSTAISGGEVLQTGYITAGNMGTVYRFMEGVLTQLARRTTTNLGDTSDTFTIALSSQNSNKTGFASLSWVEIR